MLIRIRNHSGMTIVELLAAMAIVCAVLLTGISTLSNFKKFQVASDMKAETFSDISLVRLNLYKRSQKLFYSSIFMNQTILSELSINGLTFGYPDKGGYYAIIPFKGKQIANLSETGGSTSGLSAVAGNADIDTVLMIGPDADKSLTVINDDSGNSVYDFTDPTITSGTVNVKTTAMGSDSSFRAGDIVALSTDQGTQIIKVTSYGGGKLTFATMGLCSTGYSNTNMPLGLVYSGASIEKINVYLVAVDSVKQQFYFISLHSDGKYSILARVTQAIQSMKIYNAKDNQIYTMDLAPLSNMGYLQITTAPLNSGAVQGRSATLNFVF